MTNAAVVGVFNTSEDIVDLLRVVLEQAGYVAVTALTHRLRDGQTDLEALMRQHRPQIIVYDIGPPYEQNWRLFQHIRASPACRGVRFVLTTTNLAQVRTVAGPEQCLYEIVGKPFDLEEVVGAVRRATPSADY